MLEEILEKQHLKVVSIGDKKLYIVDHHQYVLLIWAKYAIKNKQAYQLVSIDYHPDTNPPFWLYAYQKAMAIDPERESALLSIFQKRILDTLDPQKIKTLEQKMIHLRNDEHINTAMTLGYLGDYHMLNCMEKHAYTRGQHYLINEENAGKLTDKAFLESGFGLETCLKKHDELILDIDLDYFRRLEDLHYYPTKMQVFKKLFQKASFITIARSTQYFEHLKKENFTIEECETHLIQMLHQI